MQNSCRGRFCCLEHVYVVMTTTGSLWGHLPLADRTAKRWWTNSNVVICHFRGGGKVVGCGFPAGTTYTCARSPAGPRSPPRRGRWPLLLRRIPCPGPGFPAGGTSRRCSGWPVMAAECERERVHAVAITGKCLWRRSSLGRLVRRL